MWYRDDIWLSIELRAGVTKQARRALYQGGREIRGGRRPATMVWHLASSLTLLPGSRGTS